jgi:hypothetical protein
MYLPDTLHKTIAKGQRLGTMTGSYTAAYQIHPEVGFVLYAGRDTYT